VDNHLQGATINWYRLGMIENDIIIEYDIFIYLVSCVQAKSLQEYLVSLC